MKGKKISFCTVCMNRLEHLQKTLLTNITANHDYENLEFIVLDYNSTDGLEEYIRSNFNDYIDSGRLKYFKTTEPQYFNRSHSRNLAFKLANGYLICNVDADNFTGDGFASYINAQFQKEDSIYLCALDSGRNTGNKKDVLGRICVRKKDFVAISGYDEYMKSYGFEDYDFINRLQLSGIKKVLIEDKKFLEAISHSDNNRIVYEYQKKEFYKLFVNYIDPTTSEIILLLADNKYLRGSLIDNTTIYSKLPQISDNITEFQYRYSILEGNWIVGIWKEDNNSITLRNKNEDAFYLKVEGNIYSSSEKGCSLFYLINDQRLIEELLFFVSQITNRIKMQKNLMEKIIVVNETMYGKGTVFMNFRNTQPIAV